MLTTSSMRVTSLLAAALTLAACGSDKAEGPSTANNEQIIAEMTNTLEQAGNDETFEHFLGLQAAIIGLSAGAPVNAGNITIDGESHHFNTTSITLEEHDSASGDIIERLTLAVGWRHTDGDSLFLAVYAPEGDGIPMDRRAPVSLMQRRGSGHTAFESLAAMLRSGRYTVSRSVSAGPDEPALIAVKLGSTLWGALPEDGITSGSISYAAASGECDIDSVQDTYLEIDASECEMQSSNMSLQANTWDLYSEEEVPPEGPAVAIPAQTVVGAKFITKVGVAPM